MGSYLVASVILFVCWLGHAYLWTGLLNYLYSQKLPKRFLKLWRLMTFFVILLGVPLLALHVKYNGVVKHDAYEPAYVQLGLFYLTGCFMIGFVMVSIVTLIRLTRHDPSEVVRRSSHIVDIHAEHDRAALAGDGHWHWLARIPGNDLFRVEFTEISLKLKHLPPAWEGLTVLHLTDFHFHGTPSKLFFERVLQEIHTQPTPNIVALTGDYLDSDAHHSWIQELLGTLKWTECGVAILGNHDVRHDPAAIRDELAAAGFRVLTPQWQVVWIRGMPCAFAGNERPWLGQPQHPGHAPEDAFRFGLSHSPDQFESWAQAHALDLLLCGHVHGGQIRLPVIGSIFVPSRHGRKYDQGVFALGNTVMAVSRGLSGKEPLRFRCPPQVLRLTLTRG
jgi:hypothetical protein